MRDAERTARSSSRSSEGFSWQGDKRQGARAEALIGHARLCPGVDDFAKGQANAAPSSDEAKRTAQPAGDVIFIIIFCYFIYRILSRAWHCRSVSASGAGGRLLGRWRGREGRRAVGARQCGTTKVDRRRGPSGYVAVAAEVVIGEGRCLFFFFCGLRETVSGASLVLAMIQR